MASELRTGSDQEGGTVAHGRHIHRHLGLDLPEPSRDRPLPGPRASDGRGSSTPSGLGITGQWQGLRGSWELEWGCRNPNLVPGNIAGCQTQDRAP